VVVAAPIAMALRPAIAAADRRRILLDVLVLPFMPSCTPRQPTRFAGRGAR
jgi:hypothetical protein